VEGTAINVEVKLTEKDIYDFQKSVLAKRFSPISIIVFFIFFMIVVAGLSFEKVAAGGNPIGTIALILVPVIFIFLILMLLKKNSKTALKTNKLLQKTHRYQIDNEGIGATSESGQRYIKWEELYEAIETKESFLFFISKEQAYIVPKRCFGENIGQFELLRNYMKNAPISNRKKGLFFKRGFGLGCLVVYILLFFVVLIVALIQ